MKFRSTNGVHIVTIDNTQYEFSSLTMALEFAWIRG